jgi:CRP-like cAMP-binding protein
VKPIAQLPAPLIPAFTAHPLMCSLPALVRETVLRECRVIELDPGDPLMHQFDEAHSGYLLLQGRLKVSVAGSDMSAVQQDLGWVEAGAAVGELGAITGELRSANVVAETGCILVEIPRRVMRLLLEVSGEVALHLAALLGERIRREGAAFRELAHRAAGAPAAAGLPALLRRLYARFIRYRLQSPLFVLLIVFAAVMFSTRALLDVFPVLKQSGAFLRSTYMTGLGVFVLSTLALFLAYRRRWAAAAAAGIGLGLGLVVNKLSLLIAFDIFYLDMTRLDPSKEFSYLALYERSEWIYAAVAIFTALIFLVYFRAVFRFGFLALRIWLKRRAPKTSDASSG